MKIIFILLLVMTIGCNDRRAQTDCQTILEFNSEATKAFASNIKELGLAEMTDFERCVLVSTIMHSLNDLNQSKTTVVDSFYIRNYYLADIGTSFSFVAAKNKKYYFIHAPKISDFMLQGEDHQLKFYDKLADGDVALKDSLQFSFVKINSTSLDKFLTNEVFRNGDLEQQQILAGRLLPEIFSMWNFEIGIEGFKEAIQNEPDENRAYIMQQIAPMIERKVGLRAGYKIYSFEPFGWFFIEFYMQENDRLAANLFFVPQNRSRGVAVHTEWAKYRHCK
jgi:hypothetical protein